MVEEEYEYARARKLPVLVFLEDVPRDAQAVLVRGKERAKFADKRPDLSVAHIFHDKTGAEFLLLMPAR